MTLYVVMRLRRSFETNLLQGIPLELPPGVEGMLLAYRSREAAEREFPGVGVFPIVVADSAPKEGT